MNYALITLVVSVVGALATVAALPFISEYFKRRDFSYTVFDSTPLVSVDPSFSDLVKVVVDGKSVGDVEQVLIVFRNSGGQAILPSDFHENLTIDFGSEASIHGIWVGGYTPPDLRVKAVNHGNIIEFEPMLLNKGDQFHLTVGVSGTYDDITIGARIRDVPRLVSRPIRNPPPRSFIVRSFFDVAQGHCLGLLMGVGLFGTLSESKRGGLVASFALLSLTASWFRVRERMWVGLLILVLGMIGLVTGYWAFLR